MRIASLVLAIALSLAGCAKTVTPVVPGAVNSFDSTMYVALRTAQGAIEQAKTDFANTPSMKPALNKAIAAYDVAQTAYASYHQAAVAGVSSPASQASLQTQVNDLKASVAVLTTAK